MLLTSNQFEVALNTAIESLLSGREQVQRIAVTAIGYACVHGDVTYAQKVVSAITNIKGVSGSRLIDYIADNAPVEISKKGAVSYDKEKAHFRVDTPEEIKNLMEGLDALKWYDHKKADKAVTATDLFKTLDKLAANYSECQKQGVETPHAPYLEAAVAAIKALSEQRQAILDAHDARIKQDRQEAYDAQKAIETQERVAARKKMYAVLTDAFEKCAAQQRMDDEAKKAEVIKMKGKQRKAA